MDPISQTADLLVPALVHGGNFGTLWPKHEAFRLHLLRTHKGRPIVQMPLSDHERAPGSDAALPDGGNC